MPAPAPELPAQDLAAAPGYLVRRLHQAYTVLWSRSVRADLTGPQFAVLSVVRQHPGLNQVTVAGMVALDNSTMTDVARRLENRGLLTRTACPADGRRKLLTLTPAGRQLLVEVSGDVARLSDRVLAGRSAAQQVAIMAVLTELATDWEFLTGQPDDVALTRQ
ncbi:MAG TPA: MarR family transcriptional regulator [Pseudonocardiaceae bacterium]|nr:MarR family transcriptional regulator [Pseudonocardiaceae bacterium]